MSASTSETVLLFALSFGVVFVAWMILKGPHLIAQLRGVENLEQFATLTWVAILIGGGFGLFGAYYAALTLPVAAHRVGGRRDGVREKKREYLDAPPDPVGRVELSGEWLSCRECGRPVLVDCVCIGCAGSDPGTAPFTAVDRGSYGWRDDRFWESIDVELRQRRTLRLPLR